MDYQRLAQELVRVCRGRRGQTAVSQRLGFKSNQLYRWEAGLRGIAWPHFSALCHALGLPLSHTLTSRLGYYGPQDQSAALVSFLLGDLPAKTAAERLDFSPQMLGRWRRGDGVPELFQILKILDVLQGRLLEFVNGIVGPNKIDLLKNQEERTYLEKAIRSSFPMSNVAYSMLETEHYKNYPTHPSGWIAKALGISEQDEHQLLKLLAQVGAIEFTDGKYVPTSKGLELSSADGGANIRSRAYWSKFAPSMLDQLATIPSGSMFGWSVFAVSESAFQQIKEKFREAYSQILATANSDQDPKSYVKIINLQCVDFTEFRQSGAALP
jgi:transcriptional regulator with XRE-family HTH domain